ncbi:MAG TPA: hypothetical protein VMI73_01515 [Trebonia sp.]|nr:hypothetical protein [Trebonia sp.]
MLDRSSYYLSDDAMAAFRDYLSLHGTQSHFANARSVRNALEAARLRHASASPANLTVVSMDDLTRLEPSDVLADPDAM